MRSKRAVAILSLALLYSVTSVEGSMLSIMDAAPQLISNAGVDILNATPIVEETDEGVLVDDYLFFDLAENVPMEYDPVEEVRNYEAPSVNFHASMPEEYVRANTEMLHLSERYMSQINNAPYMDYIWPLAVSCVEYNYYKTTANDYNLITPWVLDMDAYRDNPDYIFNFNWEEVRRIDPALVTRRTGGAIGVFQCEKGFGSWAEPINYAEFGNLGASTRRKDCWLTLGESPSGGTSIAWKLGVEGDRWSYADALNIMAGVLQTDFGNQSGRMIFDSLPDRYSKVTLLMWGHNRGNNIFSQPSRVQSVLKITDHIDELRSLIVEHKPAKFYYQDYVQDFIVRYGLEPYPAKALAAYLILEYRINGEW